MNKKEEIKAIMLAIVTVLIIIGIVAIASISAPVQFRNNKTVYEIVIKWIVYIVIGIIIGILTYKYMDKRYVLNTNMSWAIVFICFILLISPIFIGRPINGAYRWINLPGFAIQPSEIVKPIYIVVLSTIFFLKRKNTKVMLISLTVIIMLLGIAIYFEKSNTSTLQYILIGYLMFIVSTADEKMKWSITLAGFGLSVLGLIVLKAKGNYAWKRIADFLEKGSEQANAAEFATKLGGIKGLGIGDGLQKYHYLSEAHTDYMFSAISEETGLIGSIVLLILFSALIFLLFYIALNLKDTFNKYIVFGVGFNIANQVALHIAINMKFLPSTGITLPFISYGGSSLIANMTCIALVIYAMDTDGRRNL